MGLSLTPESYALSASVVPAAVKPSKDHKTDGTVCPAVSDPNLSDEDRDSVDNNEDDKMPLLQRDDGDSEKDSQSSSPSKNSSGVKGEGVKAAAEAVSKGPRYLGVAYILLASLAFSVMTACVKYATRSVPSLEIVVWRASIFWILNYVRPVTVRCALP